MMNNDLKSNSDAASSPTTQNEPFRPMNPGFKIRPKGNSPGTENFARPKCWAIKRVKESDEFKEGRIMKSVKETAEFKGLRELRRDKEASPRFCMQTEPKPSPPNEKSLVQRLSQENAMLRKVLC